MFKEFFTKEVFTSLKRPMVYIFMFIVGLLVFGAVVSDNVIIGGSVGDVKKNAPTVVALYITILNIFGLLFATAFFNNAALRDHKYKFNEILFTTSLSKPGYFFGRFCGAWLLSTLVMLGVYMAFILGGFLGPAFNWIGPDRIGPIPWKAFFSTYLIFVVPNMFFAGAIIFALATRFKSTIVSFIGTLLIIVAYITALNFSSDMDNKAMASMLDIFGVSTYDYQIQYYTPVERNTIVPSLQGILLKNRILWFAVGLMILIFSYLTFSFKTKNRKVKKSKEADASTQQAFEKPVLQLSQSGLSLSHFMSFFKVNFLSIFKNTVFIILILFAIILLLSNLAGGFEYFGLKSYPVTYKMLDQVNGISMLFVIILLVFFSGELVWRDRDNHINEVIDGTKHSSMVSLLAKTLSLAVVGCIIHMVLILMAVLYQASQGYTNFELGLYFKDFLIGGFVRYLMWSGILVFIQVLVNQKYLGYFVSVLLIFGLDIISNVLKVESSMFLIGETPSTDYSDMNGFGPGYTGHLWFSAYWFLFGLVLLILAGLFWPRGMNKKLKDRFAVSKKAIGGSYYGALGFFSISWIAIAGYVYYNTQVLNTYDTREVSLQKLVDYEKNFKKYENALLPRVTDVIYKIDIYPEKRGMDSKAEVIITNKNSSAIDSIFITFDPDMNQEVEIPNANFVQLDEEGGFGVYVLKEAMQPGDSMAIQMNASYHSKGFENSVSNMEILNNGTFFNSGNVLATFGYESRAEISDKNRRRKYNLPEKIRMPILEDNCELACMQNYLSAGTADWVNVETYISTSEDQIAIAPGSKVSPDKIENGRKHSHFKLDHPSQNFYSFISADYEVASRKWNGIDLEVYYDEAHEINVEMMLNAIQKSLEYYTTHFGPYYHKQARIIEFPRYANFAQAFPGTMPYSESFGFIINLEENEGEHKNNVVEAVIAHEMAHQYWAHQVIGANMQGATMLSESFSEYSALMVMKKETSDLEMKEFLKYDINRYLRGRSRESDRELPLHKVENQGHIHYGKGSVILYALQEFIGEDKVNNALKGFLSEYKYQEPPYPTTHDFMRYLKPEVPDSLQYLITDWFEEITLYDLRVEEATYTKNANGSYDVAIDVIAKKTKADEKGDVTDVTIADWVDVGFYKTKDEEELIFEQRLYLDQESMQLNFELDTIPAKAAIDPYRILIDRVYDDNVKVVSEGGN